MFSIIVFGDCKFFANFYLGEMGDINELWAQKFGKAILWDSLGSN
jgi:hypothetical protein